MKRIIFGNEHYLIALFCLLILTNCNTSDSVQELSGDYFYRNEGINTKDVLSHKPNRKEIYSKITDYNFNTNFIIVQQEPIKNEFISMIGFKLREDTTKFTKNDYNDLKISEELADSIIINDSLYIKIFKNKINYWIISNSIDSVFGPFNKEEYLKLKLQLGVPENLKLANE